jgi:glycosyltransferase involved in cell wall biosynthesis
LAFSESDKDGTRALVFHQLKFSIVTPSFGQPEWLRLAIASVADQAEGPVEHIVQDGGTQGIQEMIETEFSSLATGGRLKLSVEKDSGMYDAINRGLSKATGDICAYLNCDEQYLPGALSSVEQYFATNPQVDVLFGDVVLLDKEGKPLSYRRTILPSLSHLRLAPLNTLTCATFFRRRLVEAGYLFPSHLKIAGDQYWVFQLLKARVKMAAFPKPLAVFTFTGSNLVQSEQADAERLGWLPKDETRHWWIKLGVILWHRLGKFLAGAYRRRDLSIDIYTRASPHHRQTISARSVGFRWPKA